MSNLTLYKRIAARTGAGLWRTKVHWLSALGLASVIGLSSTQGMAASTAVGDCADAAMAALTRRDNASTQSAYQCLGDTYLRTMNQEQFSRMVQASPSMGSFTRVGDHRTPDGGRIVFYAVGNQANSVGYIVYLDGQGKVAKIE